MATQYIGVTKAELTKALDKQFEDTCGYVDTRVDVLTEHMDRQFGELQLRVDRRFEAMDRRFDEVLLAIKDIRQDIKEHSHGK